jgi:hypothetical protein
MNHEIAAYPDFSELTVEMRPVLHPLFQHLKDGISELTFANMYLFRETHSYRISSLSSDQFIFSGKRGEEYFFMAPFALPEQKILDALFKDYGLMKLVSGDQAKALENMGYRIEEDRDNFDYLYNAAELAALQGRKFHRKKNLVNAFIRNFNYEGKPLLEEYLENALAILEEWRKQREDEGDYSAAKEALLRSEELVLCGGIYYVNGNPAGYTLGEEIAGGTTYVIHFEKALSQFRGLYQFINMSFASILPDKYTFINREQDLGDEGLRQAKMSYRPAGFVKKYRILKNK